jgi:hypothetical protein
VISTVEWWALEAWGISLLLVFVVFGAWTLRAHGPASFGPRSLWVGATIFALGALILRTTLVKPAFVHHDFRGPQILHGILTFPSPPLEHAFGATHGPGNFIVLGLVSYVTGKSAIGVMTANAIVSAIATLPVAFAASTVSGRPTAGLYAAAIWATSPLVARLALSEDAHIVGMLFAACALVLAHHAGRTGDRRTTIAAVAACLFAVWTRQTYYAWAPLVAGVLVQSARTVDRGKEHRPSSRTATLAAAVIVALTFARAAGTAVGSDGREYLLAVSLAFEDPAIPAGWLLDHPFVNLAEHSFMVTLFGAIGLYAIARTPGVRVTFVASFIVLLVLTGPAALPGPGIRYSFRFPHYTLAIIAAGIGVAFFEARICAWWTARHRARRLHAAAVNTRRVLIAGTVALAGAAGTATASNRAPNAELVEYLYLERALEQLPRSAALVEHDDHGPASHLLPMLAHRAGVRVVSLDGLESARAEGTAPLLVFDGLGCHARSTFELLHADTAPAGQLPRDDEVRRLYRAVVDRRLGYGIGSVQRPIGPRTSCARLFAQSVPRSHPGPVVRLADHPPMEIYERGRRSLRLRLLEWRGLDQR